MAVRQIPMQTQRLVLTEDLNQFGYLFGGRLLGWIDEASWIAASLEFPGCRFVTVGMDEVAFRHSVRQGSILSIECERHRLGTTSVSYAVAVRDGRDPSREVIFSTIVTFVNVDADGRKQPVRG